MNTPVTKSRTRFCAPKPIARPTTPAEAMNGAMFTPSTLRIASTTYTSSTIEVVDFSTEPDGLGPLLAPFGHPDAAGRRRGPITQIAQQRWLFRFRPSSSALLDFLGLPVVARSIIRCSKYRMINVTTMYATTRTGTSINQCRLVSVHSKARLYAAIFSTVRQN